MKHLRGDISENEQQALDQWVERNEDNRVLFNRINDSRLMAEALEKMDQMNEEGAWGKIVAQRRLPLIKRGFFRMKYAAALIALVIGVGSYFFFNRTVPMDSPAPLHSVLKEDIQPGKDGAVLTLSDGSRVVLDSLGNGVLFHEGNTKVVKLANGQLAYEAENIAPEKILFNTLSTDRGKQFYIQLPDGTGVWLNAASSLHYPMTFAGDERRVTVTGEAYFEIAPDASKPFIVTVNGQEVLALGTSFNINAYDDEEAIKTTLLSGRVRVSLSTSNALLNPGQQSAIYPGRDIQVKEVDVSQVVAWKNGYFSFVNADIKQIMRQLSRWYDVDVLYEGDVPKVEFSGEIGRSLTLGQLLDILNETRIHYRVENKKLIIMPG